MLQEQVAAPVGRSIGGWRPVGAHRGVVVRIIALTNDSKPLWGTMSVVQMLAHCNVSYEVAHDPGKHPRPGAVDRFFARLFAKAMVVGDKPYSRGGPTAPSFIVKDARDLDAERARLLAYIDSTTRPGMVRRESPHALPSA